MEVKGLLDKIRQQDKRKEKEYLFALEIGSDFIKSAIWVIEEERVKVVAFGSREEWQAEEKLLEAADKSLSSASEEFRPEEEAGEPNKVIFGLPAEWIEGEKIKPSKLQILKKLSQKLELKPVGFVVSTEAITHYLKTTEGVPPTAILVALTEKRITLSLIQLGKIKATETVERSQSLGDDVIEGLSRYQSSEPLPARILLWNGEDELEEAKQDLLNYSWQEKKVGDRAAAFLHLPKVEILSSDFDIKAVALAGGKEVARAAGITADFSEKTTKSAPSPAKPKEEKALEKVDFGFVQDKDVSEKPQPAPQPAPVPESPPLKEETGAKSEPAKQPAPKGEGLISGLKPRLGLAWFKKLSPRGLMSFFNKFFSRLGLEKKGRLIALLVIAFLLLVGGAMAALYWRLPRASIILLVEPKVLEEEFEIKLDPSLTQAQKEDLIFPAEEVEETVSGEKTIGTTGTKITGEKAKGEVTIYNATAQEKTLAAGTIITSSSEIEFTLDEETTIASQSGTAADPIPGKATVGVTGVEMGTEGNLAGGTEFSVGNYSRSDFLAKNDSAFTGGTSREVQVVAVEDHEELLASLEEELELEIANRIGNQLPFEKKLLEESLKSEVAKKVFSREVDEEATEVNLDLELKFTALTYDETDLRDAIAEAIEDKIPDGYEFKREESKIDFELDEVTRKGVAVFEAKLSANLVPEFNLGEIKKNLAGKYPQLGRTYLENLPNVVATEIKISPQLPQRLLTFPRVVKNIEIEVEIKD